MNMFITKKFQNFLTGFTIFFHFFKFPGATVLGSQNVPLKRSYLYSLTNTLLEQLLRGTALCHTNPPGTSTWYPAQLNLFFSGKEPCFKIVQVFLTAQTSLLIINNGYIDD